MGDQCSREDKSVNDSSVVLVVDDDLDQISLVVGLLETEGYTVLAATSAQDALDLLSSRDIDLVVSDLMMPDMTGRELIQKIRETDQELPCILATASTTNFEPDDVEGADRLCPKTFLGEMLRPQVKALLAGA